VDSTAIFEVEFQKVGNVIFYYQ